MMSTPGSSTKAKAMAVATHLCGEEMPDADAMRDLSSVRSETVKPDAS